MNDIIITKATLEDAPIILNIQKHAYLSEAKLNNDFNIPPLTQTLAELESDFTDKHIVKVLLNDEIIGSGQATLQGDTCYIGRMAIKDEFKGQGIGSKLLSNLESSFIEVKRIELFTGFYSVANLEMYARRGYKQFKEKVLGDTKVVFLQKRL